MDSTRSKVSYHEELLQLNERTSADSQMDLGNIQKEVEHPYSENHNLASQGSVSEEELKKKQLYMQERTCHEHSCRQTATMQLLNDRNSKPTGNIKALQEEFESSDENKARKEQFQNIRDQIQTMVIQMEKDRLNHADNIKACRLNFENKINTLEGLLHENNPSAGSIEVPLTEEYQSAVIVLPENVSSMSIDATLPSVEDKRPLGQRAIIQKEIPIVKQQKREETQDQSFREDENVTAVLESMQGKEIQKYGTKSAVRMDMANLKPEVSSLTRNLSEISCRSLDNQKKYTDQRQKLLAELKKNEIRVSDLELKQSEILTELSAEKVAKTAALEKVAKLKDSLRALVRENFDLKSSLSMQISHLTDELQDLHHFNFMITEQLACPQQNRKEMMIESQWKTERPTALEVEAKDMMAEKLVLQEDMENERIEALATMASLRNEIGCLEQAKDQLVRELLSTKGNVEALIKDNEQLSRNITSSRHEKDKLESQVSELNAELIGVREQLQCDTEAKAQEYVVMEQLRSEITRLTSVHSELESFVKVYGDQNKFLKSANQKKDDEIAYFRKLSTELEISQNALQSELMKLKADSQALEGINAVLHSSIEQKADLIMALEKSLQENRMAHDAALLAEREGNLCLESAMQKQNRELEKLHKELCEVRAESSSKTSQLESAKQRNHELESRITETTHEFSKVISSAECSPSLDKETPDRLMDDKDDKIDHLKCQITQSSRTDMNPSNICETGDIMMVGPEAHLKADLNFVKEELLKAERDLHAAFERELKEASRRVSILEAQLVSKATIQSQLEFQATALHNDTLAARFVSLHTENDCKDTMEAMLKSCNVQNRALEEKLKFVKRTLDQMQNSSRDYQKSATLQNQMSCIWDYCSIERRIELYGIDVNKKEGIAESEQSPENVGNGKRRLSRMALWALLVSAGSSLVVAGIKTYTKKPEN
ncbi:hypothetical protein KP509_35G027900 [Ceratopteris richardii]|nr:hypothetical protein KP509_35G027900 [Ceratopteris richardii]